MMRHRIAACGGPERTRWEDCARDATVLLGAILEIDSRNSV